MTMLSNSSKQAQENFKMRLTIATSILGEASKKKLDYLRNQRNVMRLEGDKVSYET